MALARKDEVVAWLRPQLEADAKRIALHQQVSMMVGIASAAASVVLVVPVGQWLLTLTPETAADAKSSMLQLVVGVALVSIGYSCFLLDTSVALILSRLQLNTFKAMLYGDIESSRTTKETPSFSSISEDAARVSHYATKLVPIVSPSAPWAVSLTLGWLVIALLDVKVACLRLFVLPLDSLATQEDQRCCLSGT
ncbi:hypothetical protein ATCC90586_011865 [Pythium insidiosum]|nr:hypothetical protein ATCC90586_011865 [Pythium insidiosum]